MDERMGHTMSAPATATHAEAVKVPLWAWAIALFALAVVYLAVSENGAVLSGAAHYLHEFAHDGRHALGVPCH
jgi:hypothetical protein